MSRLSRRLTGSCIVTAALLQASCTTPGGGTSTPSLAIDPTCNILAVSSLQNNTVDTAMVAKRSNDPTAVGGFTIFRSLGGPDRYGISEAWFRRPGNATVVRAETLAVARTGTTDSLASAWGLRAQDATGVFGPFFASGSANNGNEIDDSAAGSLMTPQLMTVGNANLQMFACAGRRTEDHTGRSTWLIEVIPPNLPAGTSGRIDIIQDMLYGDDHFLPNAPGPLIGPAHPPTPNVHGPGDQLHNGHAQCAMTQLDDDVTTRELHMIVVDSGHLYHSMANGFGPERDDSGFVVGNRFSMISPWADVSTALGANFGNIESATLVARPSAVSVIFEAENAGRHRLWHAVRFSTNGGSWRPADDVTAASGASLTGLVESWNVAAGICPNFEKTPNAPDELDYVTWNNAGTFFGRIVSTSRNWAPGISGIYSPTTRINNILVFPNDPNRHDVVQTPSLFTRPF
jgi:hypothetical protein